MFASTRTVALCLVMASLCPAETYLAAPFANRSAEVGLDWIGESIGESVRAALDRESVPVVTREERERAAARLSLRPTSQVSLGSLLKVTETAAADELVWGEYEVVLEPGAKPAADSVLRITARIYSRNPARERLVVTESGALQDLATLERTVAWSVYHVARPDSKLTRAEFEARHPARKVNALEDYVRGLLATNATQRHRYFAQAVRMEPGFDEALFELGLMRWRTEQFSEATMWLAQVSPSAADYLQALFLLGCSQFHQGNSAGALKSFSELLLRFPNSPEVRNNVAASRLPFDAMAATEAFAKLVEEAPGDPDYLFNYGYALWSVGQFEKAAELFRAVLDRTPNEADSLLMLGRCLKKSGPRPGDLRTAGLQRLIEDWPAAVRRVP